MNKQVLKQKAVSVLEDSIVMIVMFGVFLPVRLIFYNLVSDNWFGSFGLISGIVILMVYLSKKDKLGWFGRIYWKSITRVHKGKRRIITYFSIGFMLYFWGATIFGINYAQTNQDVIDQRTDFINTMTVEEIEKMDRLNAAVTNKDLLETQKELMNDFENIPPELLIIGFFLLLFMPLFDIVIWSALTSFMDNMLNGWFLHFGTVFFIEALEVMGVLIYTYTQTRKKNINST